MHNYTLSIEEFAFALGTVGGTEAALGFMTSTLGALPDHDRTSRLTAASHSLLARGLIRYDAAANLRSTEPPFKRMLLGVLQAIATIRCTRVHAGQTDAQTVFVSPGLAVSSQVINAVTITLDVVEHWAGCVTRIADFIQAQSDTPAEPITLTPVTLLDALNAAPSPEADGRAETVLRQANVDPELARRIVQQTRAATMRGSVLSMRAEDPGLAAEQANLRADVGFLFSAGPSSGWLFAVEPDKADTVAVYPATAGAVERVCQTFIPKF